MRLPIPHTPVPRDAGWTAWRRPRASRGRARSHRLVRLLDGQTGPAIAPGGSRDEETRRGWGPAWPDAGLPGRAPLPGRPAGRPAAQRAHLQAAVRRRPRAAGSHRRLWPTPLVRPCLSTRVGRASGRARGRQGRPPAGGRWRRWRHRPRQGQPQEPAAGRAERPTVGPAGPQEPEWRLGEEAPGRRPPPLTAPWGWGAAVPAGPPGEAPTQGPIDGAGAPRPGRPPSPSGSPLGQAEWAQGGRRVGPSYRGKRRRGRPDRAAPPQGAPGETGGREADGRRGLTPQPASAPARHPAARLWQWRRRVVPPPHGVETLHEDIHAIRAFFGALAGRQAAVPHLCAIQTPESLLGLL